MASSPSYIPHSYQPLMGQHLYDTHERERASSGTCFLFAIKSTPLFRAAAKAYLP